MKVSFCKHFQCEKARDPIVTIYLYNIGALCTRWTELARVFTHLEHAVEQVRQSGYTRRTPHSSKRFHITGLSQHDDPCRSNTAADDYCDPIEKKNRIKYKHNKLWYTTCTYTTGVMCHTTTETFQPILLFYYYYRYYYNNIIIIKTKKKCIFIIWLVTCDFMTNERWE